MTNTEETGRRFTPALRFHALTPLYDGVVRITTRERKFRDLLLDMAAIAPGQSVLDVGCGTGSLLREIARREPSARLSGLDADAEILELARKKLGDAANLVLGYSDRLPFPNESFDHVVSTLFFHHLQPGAKRATAREIARVLRPGGRLHVGDWGRPEGPVQRFAFLGVQCLDGFATTRDHVTESFPALFVESGFAALTNHARVRTPLGTIRIFSACLPQNNS